MNTDPLDMPKEAFQDILAKIGNPDSPVGIDAVHTHGLRPENLAIIRVKEHFEVNWMRPRAVTRVPIVVYVNFFVRHPRTP